MLSARAAAVGMEAAITEAETGEAASRRCSVNSLSLSSGRPLRLSDRKGRNSRLAADGNNNSSVRSALLRSRDSSNGAGAGSVNSRRHSVSKARIAAR